MSNPSRNPDERFQRDSEAHTASDRSSSGTTATGAGDHDRAESCLVSPENPSYLDGARDPTSGSLGLGASVDLESLIVVPLGAVAGYAASFPENADASHAVSLGLFYSGRASLALGVEAAIVVEPLGDGENLTTYQAIVKMQYFW